MNFWWQRLGWLFLYPRSLAQSLAYSRPSLNIGEQELKWMAGWWIDRWVGWMGEVLSEAGSPAEVRVARGERGEVWSSASLPLPCIGPSPRNGPKPGRLRPECCRLAGLGDTIEADNSERILQTKARDRLFKKPLYIQVNISILFNLFYTEIIFFSWSLKAWVLV